MADTKISALTATTTIAGLDVLPIVVDTTGTPVTKKVSIDNFLGQGWIGLGAITYEDADAPSYTFSLASDMTGILSVGMRIKLTDSTVKYFIITGVGSYSGGKTIITVYGGTDYTLSGGAITAGYYSTVKAPFGFPLSPAKWTQTFSDTGLRSQASPTQGTWYNVGTSTLSIPIGCWNVFYKVNVQINNTGTLIVPKTTLSTANNSESDIDFSYQIDMTHSSNFLYMGLAITSITKIITLTSKTSYYLNGCAGNTGSSQLYFRGDYGTTIIGAVSAYL